MDEERAKAFSQRMIGVVNSAALGLMTSIGHELGLFDTLARMEPATSEQIATAAGLNERYVREWLGAMTVGRIVEYDPGSRTYDLPEEHAASLTRAAGPRNLATLSTFLPEMGKVTPLVQQCFVKGGGVPYSEYNKFQETMRSQSSQRFDAMLLDRVLPLVDGLVPRLEKGIEVADIGCGAGHAMNLLAKAFPKASSVDTTFQRKASPWGFRKLWIWGSKTPASKCETRRPSASTIASIWSRCSMPFMIRLSQRLC